MFRKCAQVLIHINKHRISYIEWQTAINAIYQNDIIEGVRECARPMILQECAKQTLVNLRTPSFGTKYPFAQKSVCHSI